MDKLAQYLKDTGQTQMGFAEKIGKDQSLVSRYITGAAKPTLDVAVLISKVTDGAVPVDSWSQVSQ